MAEANSATGHVGDVSARLIKEWSTQWMICSYNCFKRISLKSFIYHFSTQTAIAKWLKITSKYDMYNSNDYLCHNITFSTNQIMYLHLLNQLQNFCKSPTFNLNLLQGSCRSKQMLINELPRSQSCKQCDTQYSTSTWNLSVITSDEFLW